MSTPSDLDLCDAVIKGYTFPIDTNRTANVCWQVYRDRDDCDVLIFPGTEAIVDVMRDFEAWPSHIVQHPNFGRVHTGFWNGMPEARDAINMARRPGQPLWIGAHSLGAAHAVFFACQEKEAGLPEPARVMLMGCPRPGMQDLIDFSQGLNIVSYRNWLNDVVDDHDDVTDVPFDWLGMPFLPIRPFIDVCQAPLDRAVPAAWHHTALYRAGIQACLAPQQSP